MREFAPLESRVYDICSGIYISATCMLSERFHGRPFFQNKNSGTYTWWLYFVPENSLFDVPNLYKLRELLITIFNI